MTWISWVAIGANFGAAFTNTFIITRWKRRLREWDEHRAKYDVMAKKIGAHGEQYAKLAGFAIMIAHTPPGYLPQNLIDLAKSLIPPDVQYEIQVGDKPETMH